MYFFAVAARGRNAESGEIVSESWFLNLGNSLKIVVSESVQIVSESVQIVSESLFLNRG